MMMNTIHQYEPAQAHHNETTFFNPVCVDEDTIMQQQQQQQQTQCQVGTGMGRRRDNTTTTTNNNSCDGIDPFGFFYQLPNPKGSWVATTNNNDNAENQQRQEEVSTSSPSSKEEDHDDEEEEEEVEVVEQHVITPVNDDAVETSAGDNNSNNVSVMVDVQDFHDHKREHREKNKVKHEYHDHANDPDGDYAAIYGAMQKTASGSPSTNTNTTATTGATTDDKAGSPCGTLADQPFPVRLHYMLNEMDREGLTHIVTWQPHGRCFVVHDQKMFCSQILAKRFRMSKYASFQRQLNIYGFNRITAGPDKGGYYHELFLRGKPGLAYKIHRHKLKGNGTRKAASPESEPNFYLMTALPPSNHNPNHTMMNGKPKNKNENNKNIIMNPMMMNMNMMTPPPHHHHNNATTTAAATPHVPQGCCAGGYGGGTNPAAMFNRPGCFPPAMSGMGTGMVVGGNTHHHHLNGGNITLKGVAPSLMPTMMSPLHSQGGFPNGGVGVNGFNTCFNNTLPYHHQQQPPFGGGPMAMSYPQPPHFMAGGVGVGGVGGTSPATSQMAPGTGCNCGAGGSCPPSIVGGGGDGGNNMMCNPSPYHPYTNPGNGGFNTAYPQGGNVSNASNVNGSPNHLFWQQHQQQQLLLQQQQ